MFPSSVPPARFLAGIFLGALACFLIQAVLFCGFHFGTGKSESNYFSTLSRFQAAASKGAEISLAGSSISGRLPGREVGNSNVANLGSDGGSPLDGLRFLASGACGRPKWVVLETNTLFNGVGYEDPPIMKGVEGLWFKVGSRAPLLGASARPSGMLYSRVLSRPRVLAGDAFPLSSGVLEREPAGPVGFKFKEADAARVDTLVSNLHAIRQLGIRVILVNYPAGPMIPEQIDRMNATVARLSREAGACYLDLSSNIDRRSLVFTDSVHLSPESAVRVLATIQTVCRSIEETN
jgi:hypothetical protein